MAEILVSGLLNVETSAKVRGFPINYYPIDYAFFGVNTAPGGVGFNLASALKRLGSGITLCGLLADDFGGRYVLSELEARGISADAVERTLSETPSSVVLYDESGSRPDVTVTDRDSIREILAVISGSKPKRFS